MGVVSVARISEEEVGISLQGIHEALVNQCDAMQLNNWTINFNLYRDSSVVMLARKKAKQIIALNVDEKKLSLPQKTILAEVSKHNTEMLYTMHTSDNYVFSWSEDCLVESDKQLELLIKKMPNIWANRQSCNIEGSIYSLGDYIVRVGNFFVSNIYKGIFIEVEYTVCTLPRYYQKVTEEILKELLLKDHYKPKISTVNILDTDLLKGYGFSFRNFRMSHVALQYKLIIENDNLF